MIISAVIAAILGDVDHPFVTTVKRCIKRPPLGLRAALHPDTPHGAGPGSLGMLFHFIEGLTPDLLIEILFSLLRADKADGISKADTGGAGGKSNVRFPMAAIRETGHPCDTEYAIHIDLDASLPCLHPCHL